MFELELKERAHINLRGDPGDPRFLEATAAALGQALPREANTFSEKAHRICWLGPDEWLVCTDIARATGLLERLETELVGQHVAVNDVSGGQVTIRVSGPGAANRLASGCALDLDPTVFGVGQCAQSGLAKASVLIACIEASPVYEIIVRRSFSEYLLHWLRKTRHYRAGSASS